MHMYGGQEDGSQGAMADCGEEQVGGVVLYSRAGGPVLVGAEPGQHEARAPTNCGEQEGVV